jgi:hypothetical protein
VEGKRYTLLIDSKWQDARGVPLAQEFRKAFRGGPADRTPPDPKTWRVTAPKVASTADLVVHFPKPMDFALLQRMIEVAGSVGNVGGAVSVDKQETEWRFTPREPWKTGAYRLLVDTGIEDLSGNHIGQAFDLDKFQTVTKNIETETISVPFDVR